MTAQEIAKERSILEIRTGSHLYGTNTEDSNEDFVGIFVPPEEVIYGFTTMEEVDLSKVSKRADGKNDKDAIDFKYYELRKFMKLAMENNPNILEMLFVNSDNVVKRTYHGEYLLNRNWIFPCKKSYYKYVAYAQAQKKKMIIRSEKYTDLESAREFLNYYLEDPNNEKKMIVQLEDGLDFFVYKKSKQKNGQDTINVGDINFQLHERLTKVLRVINERLEAASSRIGLIHAFGYDTKFASHLIRLLLEAEEILTDGRITFPLTQASLIKDIKLGKYKLDEVIRLSDELELKLKDLYDRSTLRETPNHDVIENLTISLIKDYLE